MSMSRPGGAPKALTDQELTALLTKVLEETLGKKIDPKEMQMIVAIAKEMIQEMGKKDGPKITKDDIKYRKDEVSAFLGKTLVAATATAMHIHAHQNKLKDLLKEHKSLTEDLKMNPNQPDKGKKELQLKELKLQIKETMGKLNQLDPNQDRRNEFDLQKDKVDPTDDLDKVVDARKKEQATPSAPGMDPLTQSLIALYGRDPRVSGSIGGNAGPEMGNEMGIPTLCILEGLADNLEKLDGDLPNTLEYSEQKMGISSKELPGIETLCDNLSQNDLFKNIETAASDVIDHNSQFGYESPSLSR